MEKCAQTVVILSSKFENLGNKFSCNVFQFKTINILNECSGRSDDKGYSHIPQASRPSSPDTQLRAHTYCSPTELSQVNSTESMGTVSS